MPRAPPRRSAPARRRPPASSGSNCGDRPRRRRSGSALCTAASIALRRLSGAERDDRAARRGPDTVASGGPPGVDEEEQQARRWRPAAVHAYRISTACRCECPMSSSRWCRCLRSALNGDLPAPQPTDHRQPEVEQRHDEDRRTAAGIGMNAGSELPRDADRPRGSVSGSIWPVTAIVDAAIRSPTSRAPASPMNSRAGCQLRGRNPMQAPMRIAGDQWTRVEVVALTGGARRDDVHVDRRRRRWR